MFNNKTKKFKKIMQNFFQKEYKPYVIGKILKKNKVKLNEKINWYQKNLKLLYLFLEKEVI